MKKRLSAVILCLCLVLGGAILNVSSTHAFASAYQPDYTELDALEGNMSFLQARWGQSGYDATNWPYRIYLSYKFETSSNTISIISSKPIVFNANTLQFESSGGIVIRRFVPGSIATTENLNSFVLLDTYTNVRIHSNNDVMLKDDDRTFYPIPPLPTPTPTPEPNVGNFNIDFAMSKTEVNITVPLNVLCYINPNEEQDFTHGDLTVTNNSYAPVKVSLSSFSVTDNEKTMILPEGLSAVSEGLLWKNLNEEQSATYFSIGIKAETSCGWESVLTDDFSYAGQINTKTPLGVIGGKESATLSLEAYHGNSFKEAADIGLRIGFIAELAVD